MKIEDYSKYYIQGSDHYLIPEDVFKELFNEMINWKEESNKQKEVIDKIKKEVNEQHTIMGCEVVENWVLLQILEDKEV